MKTFSCYRYLPRAEKNYQLKGHKSKLGRDCLCHGKATSYNSMLFIVGLHDEPVQIPIDAPWLPNSIDWDSVLTSKFWSPRYHFQARLRLSPMRLLQICQSASRLVWQISLRRTLGGFEHRFGHKLGMKSKSQHTICYASGDNNHLLHLCHCWSRTTRKRRVYKNATKYENVTKARPPMSQLPIV